MRISCYDFFVFAPGSQERQIGNLDSLTCSGFSFHIGLAFVVLIGACLTPVAIAESGDADQVGEQLIVQGLDEADNPSESAEISDGDDPLLSEADSEEIATEDDWDDLPDIDWDSEIDSEEQDQEPSADSDSVPEESEEGVGDGVASAEVEDIEADYGRVVEEVIVQAERRDASLQSTAVAVSAFSQKSLTESDISDVTDLTGHVPGLVVTSQEDQSDIKIFIRGIGTSNPTETGDQGVGVYVDGIFAARAQGALALFYDLESVQVLRGPQGTLFGRNNTGGAMLLRTRRPGDTLEGDLQLTYGSYNRQQVSGGVSIPLTDRWSLRVAGYLDRDDGWVTAVSRDPRGTDHVFSGITTGRFASVDTKLNNTDVRSARITSLFDISERAYWLFSFETFSDQGIHGIVLDPMLVTQGRYEAFIDSPVSLDLRSNVIRSTLSLTISDSTNIEYLFGYAQLDRSQVVDQDNGLAQEFREARTEYQDSPALSHEVKFAGSNSSGSLDWTAGLYYFAEETDIRFDFDAQGGELEGGATFIQPARGAVSWAAYGQVSYRPVEPLSLTLGLRYTNDLKYDRDGHNFGECGAFIRPNLGGSNLEVFVDFFDNRNGLPRPDGLDDRTGRERVRGRQCLATTINELEKRDNEVTWLARVAYDFAGENNHLFYFSVGTGYRASVIQDAGNSTEPENSISYEIGTKSDLGSVRLNTAAFFIDYTDLIRSGFDDELMRIVVGNVSAAEIFGAEVEMTWLFGKGGSINLSASWLRALIKEYLVDDIGISTNNPAVIGADGRPSGLFDLSGNTMPQSPQFQFTFGFQWEFSVGRSGYLTPRVNARFSDDVYFSDGNDNRAEIDALRNDVIITGVLEGNPIGQPAYTKVDIGLNYLYDERWSVDFFVNNLFNELTLSSVAGAGTPNGLPGRFAPPRSWGIRFQIGFE